MRGTFPRTRLLLTFPDQVRWWFVGCVWLLWAPSFLLAQQEQQGEEQPSVAAPTGQAQTQVTQLGPVVITATRTETPIKETSTSVTVITEEEIHQQQAETVAEVLRSVPGLDVAQNGSRGTTTTVFIRGAESDQTLVLIDGVEVNNVAIGAADFSNLTTENVDRVAMRSSDHGRAEAAAARTGKE